MSTLTTSINDDKAPHAGALYESSSVLNVSKPGRIISAGLGALMLYRGIKWSNPSGTLLRLLAGGYLLYRGLSGNCPISASISKTMGTTTDEKHTRSVNIKTTFTVNQPREMVFLFWRQLDNLPLFMRHIDQIRVMDSRRSEWTLKTPGNLPTVTWNAEIVEEEEGRKLSWRSLPGSMVENAGKVTFKDAPRGGTELKVLITYRPPAGYIGSSLARLLNPAFEKLVSEDIRNFKQYIETGEIPTIKGQPSGREILQS